MSASVSLSSAGTDVTSSGCSSAEARALAMGLEGMRTPTLRRSLNAFGSVGATGNTKVKGPGRYWRSSRYALLSMRTNADAWLRSAQSMERVFFAGLRPLMRQRRSMARRSRASQAKA